MEDLQKTGELKPEERILNLPNQGDTQLNWEQNSSRLREEIRKERPIRDASVNQETGELEKNTGFLRAERNLLENQGWKYDSKTRYWYPPKK